MKISLIGFTVFIIFFGAATLDAFTTRSWLSSSFRLAMGVAFFIGATCESQFRQSNNYSIAFRRMSE